MLSSSSFKQKLRSRHLLHQRVVSANKIVELATSFLEHSKRLGQVLAHLGQPILGGDHAATVSAATAALLLPILGLVYLLRGLVLQSGGRHARRRRAKHLRRRG